MTELSRVPAFDVVAGWEQKPDHIQHLDVAGVAVDSSDRGYLLCRGQARVAVYEPDGSFVRSWGEDRFTTRPHGLSIDSNDFLYVVDEDDHTATKYTLDGAPVLTLGTSGVASNSGVDWSLKDL